MFPLMHLLVLSQIARIEFIHSKNYLHRDIKPDNFLIGLNKRANLVYAIDFGLVKKYRDPKTHQHIPYSENKNLTGTARYASVNAHLGIGMFLPVFGLLSIRSPTGIVYVPLFSSPSWTQSKVGAMILRLSGSCSCISIEAAFRGKVSRPLQRRNDMKRSANASKILPSKFSARAIRYATIRLCAEIAVRADLFEYIVLQPNSQRISIIADPSGSKTSPIMPI